MMAPFMFLYPNGTAISKFKILADYPAINHLLATSKTHAKINPINSFLRFLSRDFSEYAHPLFKKIHLIDLVMF